MTILITGASSGIGAELARRYAKEGNTLILVARRENLLTALRDSLELSRSVIKNYLVDFSDVDEVAKFGKQLSEEHECIDLLIMNAGVSLGHGASFASYGDFRMLFSVNFLSTHALLEPLMPTIMSQKGGKIVFISSLASLFSMPSSIAYSSSKRALNSYAEGLSYYLLPYDVKVLTILPGFIDTELTQKNSFKMPFLMTLKRGVDVIENAIERRDGVYAFPWRFYMLIRLLRRLPRPIREWFVLHTHKTRA